MNIFIGNTIPIKKVMEARMIGGCVSVRDIFKGINRWNYTEMMKNTSSRAREVERCILSRREYCTWAMKYTQIERYFGAILAGKYGGIILNKLETFANTRISRLAELYNLAIEYNIRVEFNEEFDRENWWWYLLPNL